MLVDLYHIKKVNKILKAFCQQLLELKEASHFAYLKQ